MIDGWLPDLVTHVVTVPDSLFSPVIQGLKDDVCVISLSNENQAVAVSVGLTLGGALPLLVMENSGLRAACDTIARTVVLSNLHLLYMVSPRGDSDDGNWWAANNLRDTKTLINMFNIRAVEAASGIDLTNVLSRGAKTVQRRIASVVVLPSREAISELR